MKKRVFYVINLDRGRIWILATLLVSTLLFAFATGFRVGASRSPGGDLSSALERGSDSMELAGLGSTTGSPDNDGFENGEDFEGAANSDPGDGKRGDPGASPFDREYLQGERETGDESARSNDQSARGDRDDSQQDFTDRGRAPVMEPSSTRAAERSRESEQVRLAKAREAANERAKAERKRIAERKERDAAAKRRRELAQKSKASAQKKGARADTIKSSPGQVAVKQAGNQTGAGESKKSAPTRGDNPRSALLDTNSGTLRMANVSRQPAAAKTSDSKSEKTKAADPTVRENSARKVYSLQIGAFSSRAASERMAATLQKQGFHPYIIESRGKFIVRVGKSDTAKGLWKLETGLRKNQYAPMRVSTEAR